MYAIDHAATALLIKKRYPVAPLFLLLIAVQLVEVCWVFFNYTGLEYFSISGGRLHLDFLPWSHSVSAGLVLAALSYAVIFCLYRRHDVARAFAIGVISHIVIDILFHERDIRLSPFSDQPAWGWGIIDHPWLDFAIELLYGLFCWWYFKGSKQLLMVIVVFNVLDLPVMLASGDSLTPLARHPCLLPTFILFQILITWYFVWRYGAHGRPPRLHPLK